MIHIEIDGGMIREDRKARREDLYRRKPTRIEWEDGTARCSQGALIDGEMHVICRPGENPFVHVIGEVRDCDPKPCLSETGVHIYIDQVRRSINKKCKTGVPAIVARWNQVSRYANEIVITGRVEIAYGCWPGFHRQIGLWIQTSHKPTVVGAWYYSRLVASPDGEPPQTPAPMEWDGSCYHW
jgi:hypothetical protein